MIWKILTLTLLALWANANDDIFRAIETKNKTELKTIVEKSKTTQNETKNGETTLMSACANDFVGALDYLKEANVNAIDSKGYSALMLCSALGNAEMVEKLSKMGANINAQNAQGKTALMMAAFYGNTSTVKVLLKNGANKNLKDEKGWNALDFAKAKNKKAVITELKI